jgi:CHAD domain-containing protein
LRVRVKRLRYALESLDGGGDDATRKLARRLAKLQDRLGRHHDAVSQRAWLRREVPVFAAEPDTLLAVGMEVERLARRARKLERRMPKWLKKTLRPKLVAAAFDELAAPGAHGAAA